MKHPRWMTYVLLAAAAYNALWGLWVGLFPAMSFTLLGMEVPPYLPIWQSVGLMVGCYAIGYFIAAFNPYLYWPLVLVGFIGKVLGPLGMVYAVATNQLPLAFAWNNLTNDVVWWIPFFLILRGAYMHHLEPGPVPPLHATLEAARTQRGESLLGLTERQTVLLVLLRHAGCTFCRETLAQLSIERASIEARGVRLVLVYQEGSPEFFGRYGLADVDRVADPDRALYRALELKRGRLGQLFGWREWTRGFKAGVLEGHGIGLLEGDGFQMPGAFLLRDGVVLRAFKPVHTSDQLDHDAFCALPEQSTSPSAGSRQPAA
jgi:hypothetical protein